MECEHKQFRCTNGIFYCLKCGAVIQNPYEKQAEEKQESKLKKERGKKK